MENQQTPVDLTIPVNVLGELLDDDQTVRILFDQHFHEDLKRIAENIALSVAAFADLNEVVKSKSDEQSAVVAGIIIGVIDHLVVSTKLLISGKFFPAGNLMRTAIEGIAFACLCASSKLVHIKKRNRSDQDKDVCFWKGYMKNEPYTQGNLVIGHLKLNQVRVGMSEDGIAGLERNWKQRHQFSHAGAFATTATFTLTGEVIIGGHFDPEKLAGYRLEFADRVALTRMLPRLIGHLAKMLT